MKNTNIKERHFGGVSFYAKILGVSKMAWLAFFAGIFIGTVIGVFTMCLFQINR